MKRARAKQSIKAKQFLPRNNKESKKFVFSFKGDFTRSAKLSEQESSPLTFATNLERTNEICCRGKTAAVVDRTKCWKTY